MEVLNKTIHPKSKMEILSLDRKAFREWFLSSVTLFKGCKDSGYDRIVVSTVFIYNEKIRELGLGGMSSFSFPSIAHEERFGWRKEGLRDIRTKEAMERLPEPSSLIPALYRKMLKWAEGRVLEMNRSEAKEMANKLRSAKGWGFNPTQERQQAEDAIKEADKIIAEAKKKRAAAREMLRNENLKQVKPWIVSVCQSLPPCMSEILLAIQDEDLMQNHESQFELFD